MHYLADDDDAQHVSGNEEGKAPDRDPDALVGAIDVKKATGETKAIDSMTPEHSMCERRQVKVEIALVKRRACGDRDLAVADVACAELVNVGGVAPPLRVKDVQLMGALGQGCASRVPRDVPGRVHRYEARVEQAPVTKVKGDRLQELSPGLL